MKKEKFSALCKKHGVNLGDLPAFPPAGLFGMTDEKWEEFIASIGKAKRAAKKKNRPLRVYQAHDEEEGYVYFFVAKSHGEARYAFCGETGMLSFEESFGVVHISVVPKLEKYIQGTSSGYTIELFHDEYWVKALYAEGGSFTNGSCDQAEDKILTADEMIARECRHDGKVALDHWDDERIWITLPPKK